MTPGLAELCEEVFGDTELVYTKPPTRLNAHLKGYDPKQAPKFVWPKHLRKQTTPRPKPAKTEASPS